MQKWTHISGGVATVFPLPNRTETSPDDYRVMIGVVPRPPICACVISAEVQTIVFDEPPPSSVEIAISERRA